MLSFNYRHFTVSEQKGTPTSVTLEFKDLPTTTMHIPKAIPHPVHR